jgi:hypothetical protein
VWLGNVLPTSVAKRIVGIVEASGQDVDVFVEHSCTIATATLASQGFSFFFCFDIEAGHHTAHDTSRYRVPLSKKFCMCIPRLHELQQPRM